ncbi:hypothetical protein MBLNU13_g02553t1 [Cladosporium sp. NU13]
MASLEDKEAAIQRQEIVPGKRLEAPETADVNLLDEDGNIRRIPVPSADPNDPLNMSKWRKLGVIVTCCWYSIFSLVLVGGAGPILPFFIEEYAPMGYDVEEIVKLTTYPSLVMALGAFMILPLCIVFGRRPVLLGCCFLLLGSTIGAAKSNSYQTHMACRILQGIATGATESILPLAITDISFLDERGLLYGFYWGTQNCINAVFTITVSYLAADMGWRWFYWLLTICSGFGCLLAFVCLPETRYNRSPMSVRGQVVHTDEFGVTRVLSDEEAREYGAFDANNILASNNGNSTRKRSFISTLNPVSPVLPNGFKVAGTVLIKMLSALSSPAVIWAILASSISLGVGISMSLTYGTVLTEGFGWAPATVGLVNCGILPASLIAMFWAGWLGDKTNIWLAKRRGGTHLPEDSLVSLILPTIKYSSWGVIMGWTLQQFGFVVCLITTTHFAAEAYPSNPGPALVLVVGMKNIVSFGKKPTRRYVVGDIEAYNSTGASFGIVPMVHTWNYLTAYMVLFALFVFIFLLGIPIYFLNPKASSYEAEIC